MVFSSLIFLFIFLPAVISIYYIAPRRFRNAVLLCFSYLFYLWGGGYYFLLLFIFSTFVDYVLALLVDHSTKGKRHWWVFISICFNLSLLFYFKYANFFVGEVNRTLLQLGVTSINWTSVVLPIGISFFTFHKITYVVDVYRGTKRALVNFIDFALYLAFFPQLIAGPIIRFHEISDQFKNRLETSEEFHNGIVRFWWGLAKKMILANSCGDIADAIFGLNLDVIDTKIAWLGIFAYTLQIYFDFSAYSDMAIGLGHMFGFRLPENFNRPYSAISISDFWRRWHISLSNFFRDYLYIPLGGNRLSARRTYINLVVVFVLCGLWHGANWTFILWGLYHGGLLIFERLIGLRYPGSYSKSYIVFRRVSTLLLVMIGWVFFRSTNLSQAVGFFKAMILPTSYSIPSELFIILNGRNMFIMLIAAVVVFLPQEFSGARLFLQKSSPAIAIPKLGLLIIIVCYAVASIASGSYNPFIYFQF